MRAVVAGLAILELYKLVDSMSWSDDAEKRHSKNLSLSTFRNSFMNLGVPMFTHSPPVKSTTFPVIQRQCNAWERIDIRLGDITLAELFNYLRDEYGMK